MDRSFIVGSKAKTIFSGPAHILHKVLALPIIGSYLWSYLLSFNLVFDDFWGWENKLQIDICLLVTLCVFVTVHGCFGNQTDTTNTNRPN